MEEKIYPVIEAENQAFSGMSKEECKKMLELYEKYNMELKANIPEASNVSSIVEDFIETEVIALLFKNASAFLLRGARHLPS